MASSTVTTGQAASSTNNLQFLRRFSLIVYGADLKGLDLSNLHCTFSVKQSTNMTPNCADIRIYNASQDTINYINRYINPLTNAGVYSQTQGRVLLQGGYDSNYGVIFKGNVKQVIIGRESATDTFIDLNCGDGDLAYNYAIVNKTIAKNSSPANQVKQITDPMNTLGTTLGPNQPAYLTTALPRGKTIWGDAKDHLRNFAQQNNLTWSIQNEQIEFIPMQSYAPGDAVVITSKTGMIGAPQQTNIGINVSCLLNPLIKPGRRIQVDNKAVQGLKIDLGNPNDPANLAPPITADGIYYVLVIQQVGDNRGIEWYTKLICCTVNSASPYINSVQVGYGP